MKFLEEQRIFSGNIKGRQVLKDTPEALSEHLFWRLSQGHTKEELDMIKKAHDLAFEAHKDQRRKSGEPYIIHPLWVAVILSELEMDAESICAGLLHDVVEDTDVTLEELEKLFNPDIALLVDGVTKLGKLKYDADKLDRQAENLRKMFLAMAKDIRVIVIKLSDRLHNMRTLEYMKPEKQQEKARETMDIYSPIAGRLGISMIKVELDDLSLKYLHPDVYDKLLKEVEEKESKREELIESLILEMRTHIEDAGIKAEIYGRVKHYFSVYKKMVTQGKTLDEIMDLFALRILVNDIKDCYSALGIIHEFYTPIPGRFKDYIAMPKPNHYQALHTTVLGKEGQNFEVQIRTMEMHKVAEYGIAAHWKYKESGGSVQKAGVNPSEEKLNWLREILEWQQELSDNKEFLNIIKSDLNLFSENVYAFTPQGDVKTLPAGSTPVDFAYAIHTDVGNKMVGARVNGRLVTIDYSIKNGDQISIITSPNSRGPSRDWLNIVKSTSARNKINQWFKKEFKEDNVVRGKEQLASYMKNHRIAMDILQEDIKAAVLERYGFHDWESLLAAIGQGGLKEGSIANRLVEENRKKKLKNLTDSDILYGIPIKNDSLRKKSTSGVVIRGIDNIAVRFSKCCNPLPGDEIIGYVTRGRGVSVHRKDCENLRVLVKEDASRLIDVRWQEGLEEGKENSEFNADIKVYAKDRKGLLVDITRILTERQIGLKTLNLKVSKKGISTIEMSFDVKNTGALQSLIKSIKMVPDVLEIERAYS